MLTEAAASRRQITSRERRRLLLVVLVDGVGVHPRAHVAAVVRPALVEHHQLLGCPDRQLPQQDLVDQREDRRVRADAQGQRQDRHRREQRAAAQAADRQAEVSQGVHGGLDGAGRLGVCLIVVSFDPARAEGLDRIKGDRRPRRHEQAHPYRRRNHPQAGGAADAPAGPRDPAVRPSRPHADCALGERLQGERGEPEPAARRHDDAARSLQEAPLAGGGADVLPAAPAVRQALRGAERAGRRDRRAHPDAGRRQPRHGARRRRDHAHSAPAEGTRGGAGADLAAAACARDRPEGSADDGQARPPSAATTAPTI